ncbi:MAG: hypothetical protein R2700_12830 [Solirubrobacterales bacterium]
MDARLLDVLHDPGERALLPVAEGVDVHLDRVLEEPVEQQGCSGLALTCWSRYFARSSVE